MLKLLYSDDNDQLVQACRGVSMRWFDQRAVKSAASSAFSQQLMQQHLPDDKHFGIHAVAMGCGESYGFNKNGDFWTREGLKHQSGDYGAHTFAKYGRYYHEHVNHSPEHAFGTIKAARYNDDMDRVELIIWGDKRKAEEDYSQVKAGKTLTFSMSAHVPDDECSICQHRAKRSSEYCGCLRNNMTRWMDAHSKFAYAINHEPRFFDISKVKNPADRIAYWLAYLTPQTKAASVQDGISCFSDVWAERNGVCLPADVERERRPVLDQLVEGEQFLESLTSTKSSNSGGDREHFARFTLPWALMPEAVTDEHVAIMRGTDSRVLFGALAKQGCLLPFRAFYSYVTGQPIKQALDSESYKQAASQLPGSLKQLQSQPVCSEVETLFTPAPDAKIACESTPDLFRMLEQLTPHLSVDRPRVVVRTMMLRMSEPPVNTPANFYVKFATESERSGATAMAQAYAIYKVALAEALAQRGGQMTVDEPTALLLSSHYV